MTCEVQNVLDGIAPNAAACNDPVCHAPQYVVLIALREMREGPTLLAHGDFVQGGQRPLPGFRRLRHVGEAITLGLARQHLSIHISLQRHPRSALRLGHHSIAHRFERAPLVGGGKKPDGLVSRAARR